MPRILIWVVVVAALGAFAPSALAGGGGGIYEPFNEPSSKEQSRDFIRGLPGGGKIDRRLTESQLENGVLLDRASSGRLPGTATPTARRAGNGSGSEFVDNWLLALAAAATVLAAAGWLARQRA